MNQVGPTLGMRRIFVYGTLKEGFPNDHVMKGTRVPGRFVTARRMMLLIVGPHHVPWLMDEGGRGEFVEGEIYEVAPEHMPALDRLESVGEPGGYVRVPIGLRAIESDGSLGEVTVAEVYLQQRAHLDGQVIHAGPLAVYSKENAARYRDD
jgi:gamma-glutamylaminecyclotransferase